MWKAALRVLRRRSFLLAAAVLLVGTAVFFRYYSAHLAYTRLRQAVRSGKVDSAVVAADLAFALDRWPNSPDVHFLAARISRLKGDFLATERHLNSVKALSGGATEATQLEHLLLRVQMGDADELTQPLQLMVEAGHPDSELILETVARAYTHRLSYTPAYLVLNRWITLFPASPMPHLMRGLVLERMNDMTGARTDYLKAIELDPAFTDARLRLAELYLADIRAGDARPHLERLVTERPDDPQVLSRLGVCYYQDGETAKARELLLATVERLPADPLPSLTLGRLELQANRPAEAEGWLRRAIRIDPSDPEPVFALANCLTELGRDAEAATTRAEYRERNETLTAANKKLQDEARNPSKDPANLSDIGDLLLRVGQDKAGVYWLNRALELNASHEPTHRRLADFYERKGQTQLAAYHRKLATPAEKK